jgi:RNA polymerase sigma-70 factor (ECF subfamily)
MFELRTISTSGLSGAMAALEKEKTVRPMTLDEKVMVYFEELRLPVFRYLMRKTHNTGRAEDLTQETFLRLCRHLLDNKPLENPKAWLFTVANNLVIDFARSDGNAIDLDERNWREIEESRSAMGSDPESLLIQNERLDRLKMAVLNLTQLQRECLHLRAEGLRYREIAELLAISVSTVADAVRRATVKLAREVDSEVSA